MSKCEGMWRDGKLVVIRRNDFSVGEICMFTAEPATETAQVEFGGHESNAKRNVKLEMRVSKSWRSAMTLGKRRVGRMILFAGLILLTLALVPVTSLYLSPYTLRTLMMTTAASLILVGGIVSVIGLLWPFLEGVPGSGGYVSAVHIDPQFVYAKWGHPKFVAGLPAWEGKSRTTAEISAAGYLGICLTSSGVVSLIAAAIQLSGWFRDGQTPSLTKGGLCLVTGLIFTPWGVRYLLRKWALERQKKAADRQQLKWDGPKLGEK
jgi:hypothetical protein